jgi:P27 family predicted phage terminase small subunit
MGNRGPLPLPTKLLEKRGSKRAKLNKFEPKIEPGEAECPEWLSEDAKAKWAEVAPMLTNAGILTKADAGTLSRYCDSYGKWLRCAKFIEENGDMYQLRDEKGRFRCFMAFPQVSQYHKLSDNLTRMEQSLGLSPSGRARLVALKPNGLLSPGQNHREGKPNFFLQPRPVQYSKG